MTAASDPRCVIDRDGRRQAVIRKQLIIMLASIAAALSLANFGGNGAP